MNPLSIVPDAEKQYRLYYLISVAYVYLFTQLNDMFYLGLSLVAVIGAANRHVSEEAIFGPGFEERRELGETAQIRRTGTLFFRDKPPHEYTAETYEELFTEGELQSKPWGIFVVVLLFFQFALAVLYIYVFYVFYQNIQLLDFLGGLVLFTLIAYSSYAFLSTLWPDASQLHYEETIDQDFNELVSGFAKSLYADDIVLSDGIYEPAEAGVFTIECSVDRKFGPEIRRDVNRIAFSFCSVVSRSSYPISQAPISITTSDEGSVEFIIKGEWCREMTAGELSSQRYAEEVQKTVQFEPPEAHENEVISRIR